jgi:hypothetical protein
VALEAHALDALVGVDGELDRQLIAAQRVEIVELKVYAVELGLGRAPVVGPLVVLQDVLAIEVVHDH